LNLVRQYRLLAGLSQAALAREAELLPAYVARLEHDGYTPPDEQRQLIIATALHQRVSVIFPDPPHKTGRPRIHPPPVSDRPRGKVRKCRWCGHPYYEGEEVKIVQGETVIRMSGHYDCLIEDIRTEPYVCK